MTTLITPPPTTHTLSTPRKDEDAGEDAPPAPPRPLTEAERKEAEAWVTERRRFFPTAGAVAARREKERARAAAGSLHPDEEAERRLRRQRLQEVRAAQRGTLF